MVAALGGVVSVMAARYEPVIAPNTQVGPVSVGGLSKEVAAKRIRIWWESEKLREIDLRLSSGTKLTLPLRKVGFVPDDLASVSDLPMQDFSEAAQAAVGIATDNKHRAELKWKLTPGTFIEEVAEFVEDNAGGIAAARATWNGTAVVSTPERAGATLDREAYQANLRQLILQQDSELSLPTKEAPKRVPDAELAKITEIRSEFSTKFSAGNRNRSANLEIAAKSLDGTILMPGEEFSFNATLGRRTKQMGYKEAGIYVNGRHETGVAGGICQVSTTLYNAALYSDLKVTKRTNHSMPVPYVPLGHDAAVSFGALDLKFQNSLPTPIAISSSYTPGRLTFRILGIKDPSLKIKIVSSGSKAWGTTVKTVTDKFLPPGKKKVVEKGSTGRSVRTYRVVYQNGAEIRRDDLGSSIYRAFPRIIAVGPAATTPPAP